MISNRSLEPQEEKRSTGCGNISSLSSKATNYWSGSSVRVPVQQAQDPEFKPQYHQKNKTTTKTH
jgi:hypothetical protein